MSNHTILDEDPLSSDLPPRGYEYFSYGEQVAVGLASTIPAILSLIGSSVIISMIHKDWKNKKKKTKYRFLLCLSIADVINSLWFTVWPIPFPKGYPGIWGAMGNDATCNALGFFLQLGCMGAFYNAALSHYFYMLICHRMPERQFARQHEPLLHVLCLGFPIATSLAALFQDLYVPGALGCWISTEPRLCLSSDNDIECEKGEWALLYAWLYQGGPLCLLLAYIGFAMMSIYKEVREVSRKADRWATSSSGQSSSNLSLNISEDSLPLDNDNNKNNHDNNSHDNNHHPQQSHASSNSLPAPTTRIRKSARQKTRHAERTKEAGTQAFLYVLAYLVTHALAFVVFHMDLYVEHVPSILMILENATWPLQGALNLFVFLRPRIRTLRKHDATLNYFLAVYISLFYYDDTNPARSFDRLWFRKKDHPGTAAAAGRDSNSNYNNNNAPIVTTNNNCSQLQQVSGLSSDYPDEDDNENGLTMLHFQSDDDQDEQPQTDANVANSICMN